MDWFFRFITRILIFSITRVRKNRIILSCEIKKPTYHRIVSPAKILHTWTCLGKNLVRTGPIWVAHGLYHGRHATMLKQTAQWEDRTQTQIQWTTCNTKSDMSWMSRTFNRVLHAIQLGEISCFKHVLVICHKLTLFKICLKKVLRKCLNLGFCSISWKRHKKQIDFKGTYTSSTVKNFNPFDSSIFTTVKMSHYKMF